MEIIKLNLEHLSKFVGDNEIEKLEYKAIEYNKELENPQGKYKDYTGWVDLPFKSDKIIKEIKQVAKDFSQKSDLLVVIGIGGSYLGAKAVISALSNTFMQPKVLFAGINLSEEYLVELEEYLRDKNFSICVISKSGTTTEPAVSFRVLKKLLTDKVGEKEAKNRIVAITDKEKGALVKMASKTGFRTFEIPKNIGGRFSVLTPVGLFPIAFAGFDISELINGAKIMAENLSHKDNMSGTNIAIEYAVVRNVLLQKGFSIEILANYNPKLHYFAEWWKQLFGESEGKENKGIFPASVDFTTDLHSLGQYIQQGQRILIETVLRVKEQAQKIIINKDIDNLDNLNYLEGKSLEYINQKAFEGTLEAHLAGGVPNIVIEMPQIRENYLGQLIYFFEKSCGISAMLLGVHPFIQPGVEAYKSNMFRLLGKK
jgi:glucose-6-phosphate isomerase